MSVFARVIALLTGDKGVNQDRVLLCRMPNVVHAVGTGAGLSVVTAVAFAEPLPTDASGNALYGVEVTPDQDATAFISGKTANGFNVTMFPRLPASTLTAGTFDLLVFA